MSSAVKTEQSDMIDDQSNRNDDNTTSNDISSGLIKTEETNTSQSQNDDDNNDSNNNMYDDDDDDGQEEQEEEEEEENDDTKNNTVVENTNNDATSTSNDRHNENTNDNHDQDNNNSHQDNDNENDNEKTNLIVNYLPQQMSDEEFEELFKKYGPMKSCKIVRNRSSGLSYGFGFVDFETNEQALKAIDELNGHELETKKIKVAFARPAGQNIKQANLYIKNVPNSWTQDDVRKVFEPYGNIIQVRVLGNNRGVAFVLYDLRKQAEDALEAMNGKLVDGCESPFEIKFAADKKSSDKGGNKDSPSSSNDNRRRDRGGNHNRGSRNRRDNHRTGSMDRRKQTDGRGRGGGGRGNNQYNNNNNQSQYNNNNNNGVGPVRQQSNRMARYAPFVPVQAQPAQPMVPMPMATGYGYHPQASQQPMIPYMTAFQPMMQMNPAAGQMAPMAQMNPRDAYQAPMPMTGYPPMGTTAMAPQQQHQPHQQQQQPQAAMSASLYGAPVPQMASNQMQQQPQMGVQSVNSMRSNHQHYSNTSNSSSSDIDAVTLFVYNIGPDSDEAELRTMFGPYGSITKCNVVRKAPGGETKGFGFVTMQTRDQANAAISSLNGSMRNNRVLQVSFKK